MKIFLKEDVEPSAIYTARQIPFKQKDDVKKALEDLDKKGIIRMIKDKPRLVSSTSYSAEEGRCETVRRFNKVK